MRRKKLKYCACACVLVYLYYFFGVGDYILSKNFDDFDYPLNVDIKKIVEQVLDGEKPSVAPINYYPYRFLTNSGKCNTIEKLDLFIVIKSAMNHFVYREAIRQTFAKENLIPGKIVKSLFFLGIDGFTKSETQKQIDEEMAKYKDIIQIDFQDTYFNNTIKTMMSFRWVYEHCSTADHYFFTDDDMYVSVRNLLDFIHEHTESRSKVKLDSDSNIEPLNLSNAVSERDGHLFAGCVFKSAPQRFRSSKWRVSLDEYPWNKWPPYVTAMAYVVSNKSMKTMYVGSLFVKHFRFDDIYLGIVAKKVGIAPTHNTNFHFYKKKYTKEDYRDVIVSHGFNNHDEMTRIWNEQNNIISS